MEDIAKCKHLLCLAVCCHNDRPKHHLKPRPPPRANSENTYGPQSDGGDEVRNALAHNDIEAGVGPGGHVGVGGVIGTQAQVYHTEPEM